MTALFPGINFELIPVRLNELISVGWNWLKNLPFWEKFYSTGTISFDSDSGTIEIWSEFTCFIADLRFLETINSDLTVNAGRIAADLGQLNADLLPVKHRLLRQLKYRLKWSVPRPLEFIISHSVPAEMEPVVLMQIPFVWNGAWNPGFQCNWN